MKVALLLLAGFFMLWLFTAHATPRARPHGRWHHGTYTIDRKTQQIVIIDRSYGHPKLNGQQ